MQRIEKLHQTCYMMHQASPYLPAICKSQTKTSISEITKQFTGNPVIAVFYP
jgi:hypothetical protein